VTIEDRDILNRVLGREGGYVDHPNDKGGPTNFGVTLATLSGYLGRQASPDDVKNLSRSMAAEILAQGYLYAPRFDAVRDPAVRAALVDYAVHSGPGRALKAVRVICGLPLSPGVLTDDELAVINQRDQTKLWRELLAHRIHWLTQIIRASPSQGVFAAGWFNRIADVIVNG
jgi:lysozyme family protein